jgi:hypothetical protein
MHTTHNLMRAAAVLAVPMVTMWLGAAQAAAPPTGAVVTMVCHESGGSGLPLTDYVNNLDFGISTWIPANMSPAPYPLPRP